MLGVVRELGRHDYRGWLMCEQDTTWRSPAESAAISRAVLGHALRLAADEYGSGRHTRRVRLRDVAEVAGVSEPTVSRSLRDDPQISARTRAYVRQIAEQLGYVPNAAAQNLALRRSQTFGLMVPDVTDPVHGQIVSGFEDEATKHGYVLLISNFRYEPTQEYLGLRALISNQAAGIAIFGGVVDPALVQPRSRGTNLVLRRTRAPDIPGSRRHIRRRSRRMTRRACGRR